MALSQAAFSSELNVLHSVRTCGVLQLLQASASADQRTTRATEKAEGKSMAAPVLGEGGGRRLGMPGMRWGTYPPGLFMDPWPR